MTLGDPFLVRSLCVVGRCLPAAMSAAWVSESAVTDRVGVSSLDCCEHPVSAWADTCNCRVTSLTGSEERKEATPLAGRADATLTTVARHFSRFLESFWALLVIADLSFCWGGAVTLDHAVAAFLLQLVTSDA